MPNDTSFAVLYRKFIERNFDADPEALARIRGNLAAQLSAHSPPGDAKRLWTQTRKYDTIQIVTEKGETEK